MPHDRAPTALLVLRAWREDGSLRVRVSSTPDVSDRELAERVVATDDAVVAAVREWLATVP
jgi:hypothetical protein